MIPTGLFEIRDMADAPILYTAIITGDKDFDDVAIEKPTIMTIVEFENE